VTFQELMCRFAAGEGRRIQGRELQSWTGLEGPGFIIDLCDPDNVRDCSCAVLGVRDDGLRLEIYNCDGDLVKCWDYEGGPVLG